MTRRSHVLGFDDAPFPRTHRGDVLVVGAVFAGLRLDGVVATRVARDGDLIAGGVATGASRGRA